MHDLRNTTSARAAAAAALCACVSGCAAPQTAQAPPVVAAAGSETRTAVVGRAGGSERLVCPEGEVVVGAEVGTELPGVSSMRLLCRPVVAAAAAPSRGPATAVDEGLVATCEAGDSGACQQVAEALLGARPYDRDAARARHFYELAIRAERERATAAVVATPTPPSPDYGWIVQTGVYEYRIEGAPLEESLQDLTELGRQARVIPNYRGGKYDGLKLVGVRPGSMYRALGIRSGDIIQDVNGERIDSPNEALELYESLKTSDRVVVGIERRGVQRELVYVITGR